MITAVEETTMVAAAPEKETITEAALVEVKIRAVAQKAGNFLDLCRFQ